MNAIPFTWGVSIQGGAPGSTKVMEHPFVRPQRPSLRPDLRCIRLAADKIIGLRARACVSACKIDP
jgi:hypothetical protein